MTVDTGALYKPLGDNWQKSCSLDLVLHAGYYGMCVMLRNVRLVRKKKKKRTNSLAFSTPFNSNTTHIGSILRKHWHLIENDPTLKILWPNTPLITYERNKNLKDKLIHSKFLKTN